MKHSANPDVALREALYKAINGQKIKRKDVPQILRIAFDKPVAGKIDRRKSRVGRGLRRLFMGLYWNVFAVTDSVHWKTHPSSFSDGDRKITHKELKAVTGLSPDEIKDNLQKLQTKGFLKRTHFKHRPIRDDQSWKTDLWITLCPSKLITYVEKLRSISQKVQRPRRRRQPVSLTPAGPESADARVNRLAAVLLQHSTNWKLALEEMFFREKQERYGTDDRRVLRVADGTDVLLRWLVQRWFPVDEFGGWRATGATIDECGFKPCSIADFLTSGCSRKQLRLARSELIRLKILEESHERSGRRVKTPSVRVNFALLIESLAKLAKTFRCYSCGLALLDVDPDGDLKMQESWAKSSSVFGALIPPLFLNSSGLRAALPLAGTGGATFTGDRESEMKEEAMRASFVSLFFPKWTTAGPDCRKVTDLPKSLLTFARQIQQAQERGERWSQDFRFPDNDPGVLPLLDLRTGLNGPGMISILMPANALLAAAMLREGLSCGAPYDITVSLDALKKLKDLVLTKRLTTSEVGRFLEWRQNEFDEAPAKWDVEWIIKRWHEVKKVISKPAAIPIGQALDWMAWRDGLPGWFETMRSRFLGSASLSRTDLHFPFWNVILAIAPPNAEAVLRLRNHLQEFPELYVVLRDSVEPIVRPLFVDRELLGFQRRYLLKNSEAERIRSEARIAGVEPNFGMAVTEEAPQSSPGIVGADACDDLASISGVPRLDLVIRPYVKPGSVTLILGATGTGKTMLAMQFALEMKSKSVLFNPNEMSEDDIRKRLHQRRHLGSETDHVWMIPEKSEQTVKSILSDPLAGSCDVLVIDGISGIRSGDKRFSQSYAEGMSDVRDFTLEKSKITIITAQLKIESKEKRELDVGMISCCSSLADLADTIIAITAICGADGETEKIQFLQVLKPVRVQIPVVRDFENARFLPSTF